MKKNKGFSKDFTGDVLQVGMGLAGGVLFLDNISKTEIGTKYSKIVPFIPAAVGVGLAYFSPKYKTVAATLIGVSAVQLAKNVVSTMNGSRVISVDEYMSGEPVSGMIANMNAPKMAISKILENRLKFPGKNAPEMRKPGAIISEHFEIEDDFECSEW